MDWDRYSYARNNPVRYSDPSGHVVDDGCRNESCNYGTEERRADIFRQHNWLKGNVEADVISDLEALAQLSDYAAGVSGNCVQCYLEDMGATLTGLTGNSALSELLIQAGTPNLSYHSNYNKIRGSSELMQTGYAPEFQDPGEGGENQAHHYWFYVQVGFESSFVAGVVGSSLHETFLARNNAGKSYEDYALGVEGALHGQLLRLGIVSPSDMGTIIRNSLSPGSYSAYPWSHPYPIFIPPIP